MGRHLQRRGLLACCPCSAAFRETQHIQDMGQSCIVAAAETEGGPALPSAERSGVVVDVLVRVRARARGGPVLPVRAAAAPAGAAFALRRSPARPVS